MGPKITVDSATLMNKGLEVIEAHWLFSLDYGRIDVVIHPQSTVHGIVEFVDGSMLMQAAPTDMRVPIQAALSHPESLQAAFGRVDLTKMGSLDFARVDGDRWPCIGLAYEAGGKGGAYPAVLNAANEEAVTAFLAGRLAFTAIPRVLEAVLAAHDGSDADDLDGLTEIDRWARSAARRSMPIGAA
jgi:1-deoxy-D-xylulose-5-phosphate reductoisomerase